MEIKSKNYYQGTLDEFKGFLATCTDEIKAKFKKCTTLIGPKTDEGEIIEKDGYIYAHGVFYKLSSLNTPFDPSDYPVLNLPVYTRDKYGNGDTSDDGLVTKGYMMAHTSFETLK